jgi:transposase
MIAVPVGVRIVVAARPVDFRNGLDGLAALVQQALRDNPFAGDLFVFRASAPIGSRSWPGTAPVCACFTSAWRRAVLSGRRCRTGRFA